MRSCERCAMGVLSVGGLGYSPRAPGTAGTLGGLAQFFLLAWLQAEWLLAPLALVWCGLTVWLAPVALRRYGRTDPQQVVSDEVAGVLIALVATAHTGLGAGVRGALAFGLFRLFDIAKPGPVRWAERAPAGWGITADDVVAGLLANLCLQLGAALWG